MLEIHRKNKNEEDQTNHRDIRILTWKTLQCEGKNHGHQPITTFTIFMECLQECHDMFQRLTRGLYSKTLIHTGPSLSATGLRFARQLGHLQKIWIIIQHTRMTDHTPLAFGLLRVESSSIQMPSGLPAFQFLRESLGSLAQQLIVVHIKRDTGHSTNRW
jgi:hypothetical protein